MPIAKEHFSVSRGLSIGNGLLKQRPISVIYGQHWRSNGNVCAASRSLFSHITNNCLNAVSHIFGLIKSYGASLWIKSLGAHQRDMIFKAKMLTYKPNSLVVALKKFGKYNCMLTKENENWGGAREREINSVTKVFHFN